MINYCPQPVSKPNKLCNLVIDTTWFTKENCLTLYWDHNQQYVQHWKYSNRELSDKITEDLLFLKEHGVKLVSTTSDSSKIILKAVNTVYPEIPKQRCLIHLHRESLNWLTREPKDLPSQELVKLIHNLLTVRTLKDKIKWLERFNLWKQKWLSSLKQLRGPKYDYSQRASRILRVVTYLNRSLDGLFTYLDNSLIPWHTNGLEGRFGSLKQHYRQHRGLIRQLRGSYLAWYVTVIINKSKNLPTHLCY